MKCFKKLVWGHIMSLLPNSFDPHQFAYRAKRSTEDAVARALHAALFHLEQPGRYAWLLFVDYSSTFNAIAPHKLVDKLGYLGLQHSTCMWVSTFLSSCSQRVRMSHHTSTALSLSTGSTQGCVLSPLLYTLLTNSCSPAHVSNTIVKFANNTTVLGLISGGDESAYRHEVEQLRVWCRENNLLLNTSKTKELVIDFRKKKTDIPPLLISRDCVERVADFHFLGVHIEHDLTWSVNTSELLKKVQQRLYFLRVLRTNITTQRLLVSSCTVAQRKELQRIINTAFSPL